MSKAQKQYFSSVDPKVDFPKQEDDLIKFWKKNKIFERSIEKNPKNKTWTFLDGPPFITGLPHYGTLLSSIPKDLFPRFWTMMGYRVRRVWGWDCHGLPAENKVENRLGIERKRDILEKIGVGKFIKECKNYVSEVSSEWEWYVDHIARWVDFKNAYKTMDRDYMESTMWVFANMYKKGYIYKGLRVSLYCPHCSTPISNFEVAMDNDNYKEISEDSTYYKFKLKDESNTYLLAWSTTPWNKLVTTALAVNPKLTYVKIREGNEYFILAKTAISKLHSKKLVIVKTYKGTQLEGIEYIPLYDFFKVERKKISFRVVTADFVTADEGTGIVTIAPYGEEDLELMHKKNIHIELHVDEEGIFKKNVPNWPGMFYLKADKLIDDDLSERGLIYKREKVTHTIPTCWRCHTRLFYNPQNAWFVDINLLRPKLFKNNESINWVPKHFKYGRFLKSMQAAPDWCISRSRYWGSPVPVWECECGERFVPESISDLERASGHAVSDLHKPEIDDVKVECKKCGKTAGRVPEVLDSWIEAGSAPLAERHFPFEKNLSFSEFFPPDFIVEYTGQIRAWFYVLHVISTALFDSNAFKNVLVTGVILGTDGRKMSKNFGNYPDPREMLEKYGGDALRIYLMGTPVMRGEDVAISEQQYRDSVRAYLLILWNIYNYFVTYAAVSEWSPAKLPVKTYSVIDEWILKRLDQTIVLSETSLKNFDTISYVDALKEFVTDFSGWYLRRSREREDRNEFFATMYYVLVTFCKISAPLTPFISESMYRNLSKEESVHLAGWPNANSMLSSSDELLDQMKRLRKIVEVGHALRKKGEIPVRQPLNQFSIADPRFSIEGLERLLLEELNIKSIKYGQKDYKLDTKVTPELKEEARARELVRKIQVTRKEMKVKLSDQVLVKTEWIPKDAGLLVWIKGKTLSKSITKGEFGVKKV